MRILRWPALTIMASCVFLLLILITTREPQNRAYAQSGPSMLVPNLAVKTEASGLNQPTSMAFLGADRFFVLEKATGKLMLVENGAIKSTVLDLGVNGI